ncbi:MAG: hypothetical protein Q8O99_01855 [bacterium]|nr:hypothetical protein [bacterium]
MGQFVVGDFFPAVFGAIAVGILFLGGLCLAMGLFRKITTILIGVVML